MFSFFKKQDDEGDRLNEVYLDADSKVDLYSDYGCDELREEAERERDDAKSDEDEYWASKSKWKLMLPQLTLLNSRLDTLRSLVVSVVSIGPSTVLMRLYCLYSMGQTMITALLT